MFVVYAHRGASEYYPENTLSSFYAGIDMGANGIENDIQETKDGVLVVFHDDNLKRVTGFDALVKDCTYAELMNLTVKNESYGREDKICTLDDFIKYIAWRDLTYAIEIKQRGIVGKVMDKLEAAGIKDKCIITSFIYEELVDAARLDRGFRLGWLYWGKTDSDRIEKLHAIGATQSCPKANDLTDEELKTLHENGFEVRAWGISDTDIMKSATDMGVDGGMTVNFPDKLIDYVNFKK